MTATACGDAPSRRPRRDTGAGSDETWDEVSTARHFIARASPPSPLTHMNWDLNLRRSPALLDPAGAEEQGIATVARVGTGRHWRRLPPTAIFSVGW